MPGCRCREGGAGPSRPDPDGCPRDSQLKPAGPGTGDDPGRPVDIAETHDGWFRGIGRNRGRVPGPGAIHDPAGTERAADLFNRLAFKMAQDKRCPFHRRQLLHNGFNFLLQFGVKELLVGRRCL